MTLKAARVNVGLTQNEVAEKLEVNETTIIRWESGETSPTMKQAKKLCELYQVNLNDINW